MHARVACEEQPYAPGRAGGGAIAPDTGLDRQGPLVSPPARSATTVVVASVAAAALVERREDEAMSHYSIFAERS